MSITKSGSATQPKLNFTPSPVILTNTLREDLVSVFRVVASRGAKQVHQESKLTKSDKAQSYPRQLFAGLSFHGVDLEDFLCALCEFSIAPINEVSPHILNRLYAAAGGRGRLAASQLIFLRQHAKFALYSLWAQGKLLLPITFSIHTSLSRAELHQLTTELALFCLTFPKVGSEGSTAFRMVQHVPRWLVCTSWHTPEDVSMSDGLVINRFLLDCSSGMVGFPVPSFAPSVGLFLHECLKGFPDRAHHPSV